MIDKEKLVIDDKLNQFVCPLTRKESLQLERQLITEGCKEPITVWGDIIIAGHKQYELCKKYGIQFEIEELQFDSREAVISWICAAQLKRNNISEATRKFLIGMQYEYGKIAARVSSKTRKVVDIDVIEDNDSEENIPYRQKTAYPIAIENNICTNTVQKYGIYARAIEKIGTKEPKLVSKILSGQYKFSHNYILKAPELTKEELQKLNRKIERNPNEFLFRTNVRNNRRNGKDLSVLNEIAPPSVKDMPEFDPDAEIKSLSLTIPSWQSSIERAKRNTDFLKVSGEAKANLKKNLHSLSMTIVGVLLEMEE